MSQQGAAADLLFGDNDRGEELYVRVKEHRGFGGDPGVHGTEVLVCFPIDAVGSADEAPHPELVAEIIGETLVPLFRNYDRNGHFRRVDRDVASSAPSNPGGTASSAPSNPAGTASSRGSSRGRRRRRAEAEATAQAGVPPPPPPVRLQPATAAAAESTADAASTAADASTIAASPAVRVAILRAAAASTAAASR